MIDSGRGTTRVEGAQGTSTLSDTSPSTLVYEEMSEMDSMPVITFPEAKVVQRSSEGKLCGGGFLSTAPQHRVWIHSTAVERIRHIQHSQGLILALALRSKTLNYCGLFPPRSEVDLQHTLV